MTTVVAAVVERNQNILICRRKAGGAHALKWEFPGGKVEAGEGLRAALQRELREELGVEAEIGSERERYEYAYPSKSPILLVFFEVKTFRGELENRVFAEMRWVAAEALPEFDFLEGDVAFVNRLATAGRKTERLYPGSTVS